MTTTYAGGCHCGAVRFEVDVEDQTAVQCNCRVCRKKGFLHVIVNADAFRMLAGEGSLQDYRFNTGVARHRFCRTCGVHGFYHPRSHPEGISVNANCLDGDSVLEFAVEPFDGQRWEESIAALRAKVPG